MKSYGTIVKSEPGRARHSVRAVIRRRFDCSIPCAAGRGLPALPGQIIITSNSHATNFSNANTMKTTAVSILFTGSLLFASGARGQVVFQDNFDGSINSAWIIKNNDASFYSISTNGLTLRCCSADMYGGGTNYNNLFLITNPAPQDFVFTAKVRWMNLPTANYGQFALVAYDDAGSWARVDHVYGGGNMFLEAFAMFSGTLATGDYFSKKSFGTNEFWIQMRKEGATYSEWFSTDGTAFSQINPSFTYGNGHPSYLGFVAMVDPNETATVLLGSVTVTTTRIQLAQPILTNSQIVLNFTVTGGSPATFHLLQTGRLNPALWVTNSSALFATNAVGSSYRFTVTNDSPACFYRVQTP